MYTLPMSWPFRVLALTVVLLWGFVPQLACFVPEETLTEAEHECCEQMAAECGSPTMTHACCPSPVRTDAGTVAKVIRHAAPQFQVADVIEFSGAAILAGTPFLSKDSNAPPHDPGTSSLILRI